MSLYTTMMDNLEYDSRYKGPDKFRKSEEIMPDNEAFYSKHDYDSEMKDSRYLDKVFPFEVQTVKDVERFDYYQEQAMSTAVYPNPKGIVGLAYTALGLTGEAGEVANKVKKVLRDDDGKLNEKTREDIKDEVSDCFWYLAAICTELGLKMSEVAEYNLDKLAKRKKNNTIKGSGDR